MSTTAQHKTHPEDSTLAKEVWRVVYAVITFLLGIVVVIAWLPTSLIARIYRTVGISMVKKKMGDKVMMASGGDAVWLQDTAENQAIIITLITLKGQPLDISVYQNHVLERMINKKDPDNPSKYIFQKLKMYAKKVLHRYVWVLEDNFDIKEHVYISDRYAVECTDHMRELVCELGTKPLKEGKSPWEFILVPSYKSDSEKFYAVFRIHHSIGDGISLVKAFVSCMTDNPPEEPKIQRFGSKNPGWMIFKAIFEGPGLVLARFLKMNDNSILHGPRLSGRKTLAWSEIVDLNLIKKIKSVTGTTVNDVLMSCLAGAFREYIKLYSPNNMPKNICAYVPVDIRQSSKLQLDNQFGLIFLDLPLDEDDPKELLIRTKKRMDLVKSSSEPLVNNLLILYTMARIPSSITEWALNFFSKKNSMVLSNVPGPSEKLSVLGHEVEDLIFWPPQRSNVALGVSILSYNGGVRIGIMSDKAVVNGPSILVDFYVDKLKELASCLKIE